MATEKAQQTEVQAVEAEAAVDDFAALLRKEFKPGSDERANRIEQAVATLAQQVLENAGVISDDAFSTIDALRAAIDRKLTEQVNLVIHNSEFMALESAWRGLNYLVMNTSTGKDLKIRVMNASKDEIRKMFRQYRDAAWDQSPLFKKVYESEFGQLGGQPYGAFVCDYYFDHSAPNLEIMKGLSKIGAAAHAPFIAAAEPSLIGMENWTQLSNPRDIAKQFDATEYAAWRTFRETSDSRYLALTMPRFLGRTVYGAKTEPVDEFDFEEDVGGEHDKHVWLNASYAMGVRVTEAFSTWGWCSRIRGVESGGTVENLPTAMFPTDDGGVDMKCPTEIAISDRREAELSKAGLMPLIHRKNTDHATFIGAQTVHKPAEYEDPAATANANLSARLPYIFSSCRFAHYLKCMVRDWVGGNREAPQLQRDLHTWIMNYVDGSPDISSEETKAKLPLKDAKIEIIPDEENPGYYKGKFMFVPHYQLEGMDVSLSMVSRLPKNG
ncbi:type VI secretion system contractile sheath large subunit [Novosphingobium album (ex Liu et al. 2023)]|uniref:Type VI secretion system contractile sheath large subunit n=1 Tax=Novosphingobium album (ex Liu et al. 2023) TaxID=3031130 RepID=A0ABT5WUY2_9SPHN|nr:type VI secretion system contractile sheath large subunit [Novosphingobium album (ex Liu et al. 2023)]MDE8653703.1 type VI secretion system contractile sheath large subunit [Novosphingobium album (ex Liu et al. 2023)]